MRESTDQLIASLASARSAADAVTGEGPASHQDPRQLLTRQQAAAAQNAALVAQNVTLLPRPQRRADRPQRAAGGAVARPATAHRNAAAQQRPRRRGPRRRYRIPRSGCRRLPRGEAGRADAARRRAARTARTARRNRHPPDAAQSGSPRDAGGWTVLAPAAGARVVYVSSSLGNPANDGLSPDRPLDTIAKASALLRDGVPDQILLRRGDTFNEVFGNWVKSGAIARGADGHRQLRGRGARR